MGAAASAVRSEASLLERLADARRRTDDLLSLVRPEALYDRPIAERHRIIFYLGHLEAFDWNLLGAAFEMEPFHPHLGRLFAFGIDPVGGGLPNDRPSDWPSAEETRRYARLVRAALDDVLAGWQRHTDGLPAIHQLLHVAIEHRLMHAETLAYMLHQMPYDRKLRAGEDAALWAGSSAALPVQPPMVTIPAGTATLGMKREDGTFGWDNEFDEHSVSVPDFRMDVFPVTNGEFLKFLEQDGYRHRSLWSDADWDWLRSSGIAHPAFWVRRENQWAYRTMFEEIPLPLDWPVYVSHAEANAYARWAGKELPSEAEWHRAAYGSRDGAERPYPWGKQRPDATRGNFDFCRWDASHVGAFPAGASAFGVNDLLGNGWEWTGTAFAPFQGFQPFSFYQGYSANFFDGQHYVLKGGSARTAACMLRRSFRNWFQPHYGYVYAGFRCVEH